ncbi:hypothetical protein DRO66_08085 [Candidatus Bathyarchaeota archaeon]|nr:MAG: hypothetical protein DRO66_08085 [Candidatus Bathyarchaeota archaeon]
MKAKFAILKIDLDYKHRKGVVHLKKGTILFAADQDTKGLEGLNDYQVVYGGVRVWFSKLEVAKNNLVFDQLWDDLNFNSDFPHVSDMKDRREFLGFTMRYVEDRTGVSASTISRLERGRPPLYETVRVLHEFYSKEEAYKKTPF